MKISSRVVLHVPLWKNNIKQVCIPVGCVPPACWLYLPACNAKKGCLLPERGCLLLGGGVWYSSMHWDRPPTPPVNRILDTLLKILPCPNFVAGGNYALQKKFCTVIVMKYKSSFSNIFQYYLGITFSNTFQYS